MALDPTVQHPDYIEYQPVWKKCRDAKQGQRAIHKGGPLYLPKLAGQEDANYLKYVKRGNFFNATGRTIEAMIGLVMRKPMTVTVPPIMEPWMNDITLSDETLTDFAEGCLAEVLTVARGGIFVDMPEASDGVTVAQVEAQNIRPYLVQYQAESILYWKMGRINNRYQLIEVRLSEWYERPDGEKAQQVRQLLLSDGIYSQAIWQRPTDGAEWAVVQSITPLKAGTPFSEIPFYALSARKPTMDVVTPPIEALVDVNIAHYQNSADLENGAHIAGQPTPWVAGLQAEFDQSGNAVEKAIYIGSSTFLTFADPNTKVGFLQCGSEGFATLEKLMDRKQEQMAALGARMLAPEKKDAEAAQTHEIKRGGESSILSATCGVVERQLEKALQFAAEWMGIAGEISVELNRDFFPPNFTGADLTAWVAARQAGEISKETLFGVLKAAEWLPDDRTFEQEQDAIKEDGPPLGTLTDKPPAE
ncbi:DUF4055 domain-containing protein [Hymenobacter fodinae]|uniref:DUF4055 domain-containing protein n=1 Tax=Hymenobacter fodinae TaxID=2510796 RepID=A0A4Z0P1M7_9BACT|nr:DUF4055 domain-containing protein [Hymenobacter fodinae]TGE04637.1 DUF4055 domain-containing protein [Hymenobacter fodinae]